MERRLDPVDKSHALGVRSCLRRANDDPHGPDRMSRPSARPADLLQGHDLRPRRVDQIRTVMDATVHGLAGDFDASHLFQCSSCPGFGVHFNLRLFKQPSPPSIRMRKPVNRCRPSPLTRCHALGSREPPLRPTSNLSSNDLLYCPAGASDNRGALRPC